MSRKPFAALNWHDRKGDFAENKFVLMFESGDRPLIKIQQGGWDGELSDFTVVYCGANKAANDEDLEAFGGEVLGVLNLEGFVRLCALLEFEKSEDGWIIPADLLAKLREGRRNTEDGIGYYEIGDAVIKRF